MEWISRFKNGNINDIAYQREIIDVSVNSVYVYGDRLLLTYNYRDGNETLTLEEIEYFLSSNSGKPSPP